MLVRLPLSKIKTAQFVVASALLAFSWSAGSCQASEIEQPPLVVLNQIHPAMSVPVSKFEPEESQETEEFEEDSAPLSLAQAIPSSSSTLIKGDVSLPGNFSIAQSVPSDSLGDDRPLDLTPVSLPRRAPAFDRFDQFKAGALYRLPSKIFFSAVVDNSVRLETNVFQTNSRNSSDLVYRVLPNITVGYALTKQTRVACNYFLLRDQYTEFNRPLSRTLQSVGFRVDHDVPLRNNANLSFGLFSRALFSSLDYIDDPPFLNDILPSVTLTKQYGRRTIAYASCLGQIRFRRMLSRYQEFDQFYSGGVVYRKGGWTFLGDGTLASNFGRPIYRGGPNNQVVILTQELARKIHHSVPIQTFIRSQEIFNIGAPAAPGFAGFNYRIFGGLRVSVSKPPIFPIKLKEI